MFTHSLKHHFSIVTGDWKDVGEGQELKAREAPFPLLWEAVAAAICPKLGVWGRSEGGCSQHTAPAATTPVLQVETHLCVIPILWSPQVLFGLLHRLRNLKPFPAGKEKDQNHLDLTLCSFHDKVKKPGRCCV